MASENFGSYSSESQEQGSQPSPVENVPVQTPPQDTPAANPQETPEQTPAQEDVGVAVNQPQVSPGVPDVGQIVATDTTGTIVQPGGQLVQPIPENEQGADKQ